MRKEKIEKPSRLRVSPLYSSCIWEMKPWLKIVSWRYETTLSDARIFFFFSSVLKSLTSTGSEISLLRIYLRFCPLIVRILHCATNSLGIIGDIVYKAVLRLTVENFEITALSMHFLLRELFSLLIRLEFISRNCLTVNCQHV